MLARTAARFSLVMVAGATAWRSLPGHPDAAATVPSGSTVLNLCPQCLTSVHSA